MHGGTGDVAVQVVVLRAGEDGVEVGEGSALGGFAHELSTVGCIKGKLPTTSSEGL
ncbi:hypothetical protein D9M71_479020 [compost metagenome]